jgi:putative oligomerization/nucleic acid binding protein
MPGRGRDRRQRRRRVAAVGAAGLAAKKHHDAKVAGQEEANEANAQPSGQAAAAPADGLSEDTITRLKELGELHEQNVLSDEEFEQEKAKLLD